MMPTSGGITCNRLLANLLDFATVVHLPVGHCFNFYGTLVWFLEGAWKLQLCWRVLFGFWQTAVICRSQYIVTHPCIHCTFIILKHCFVCHSIDALPLTLISEIRSWVKIRVSASNAYCWTCCQINFRVLAAFFFITQRVLANDLTNMSRWQSANLL